MASNTVTTDSTSVSCVTAHRFLLAFFLIAFALRLWVALALPRIAHIDEVFQSQEPAHYLAYGYGMFTWEWKAGIRSWVFPAFLAGVMRATSWMGAGSSGYLLGIKLVLSLLSLTTVGVSFAFAKRESGNVAAILAAGTCAMWFSMVDYGPRAMTEVVSAHLLFPGLYLGVYGESLNERRRMLAAGFLCALAACLRIQYAPVIAFALLYFCFHRPAWRRRILPLALGILVPVIGFGWADAITWSYPFSSFVRYFSINAIQGGASQFGVLPWYWYLTNGMFQGLGPLPIFAIFGVRRSPFLGWTALILLLSHSIIPHKEVRFLYALWPIAITLAAIGTVEIAAALNRHLRQPLSARTIIAISLSFSATVVIGVLVGYHYFGRFQGSMVLFDELSRDPQVCGVGMVNFYRTESGGYTHLHRDVPIIFLPNESAMNETAASFNVLISGTMPASPPEGFSLARCRYASCLYERPGACAPAPSGNDLKNGTWRRHAKQ